MTQQFQPPKTLKGQMRIIPFCFLLIPFLLTGCSHPGPVHKAMIGHWKEVSANADASNPGYVATNKLISTTELYISSSTIWVVEPGKKARKIEYDVSDENTTNFSLTQVVTTPGGERISSQVSFSADRTK